MPFQLYAKTKIHSWLIPRLIFFSILIVLYIILGFPSTFSLRPQALHQWAQCDRASVALNFSTETVNIFKPRIHNISNGTGITGMEFPFVNYIVGMLYRVFGFHEFIYRLIMMCIVSLGLLAAWQLGYLATGNIYVSFASVTLMFLSPVLVFYTPNFLPDAAGLGFILCGWYYFFALNRNYKFRYIILLLIFCSLASLVKITNLVSVMIMLAITLGTMIWPSATQESKNLRKLLIALLVPLILTLGWYYYASWLSEVNHSNAFLLGIKSVSSYDEFIAVISNIRKVWFNQYYSKYMDLFILATFIVIILNRKKIDPLLFKTTMWLWVGNLGYFFLMMAQFPDHDYYIISMLPVIFFQVLAFFEVTSSFFADKKLWQIAIVCIAAFLIVHGVWFSHHIFSDRYDHTSWMRNDPQMDNYYNLAPYLRTLGIQGGDKVISTDDYTTQTSLYLMDQKGVTLTENDDLEGFLSANTGKYQYLVINDRFRKSTSKMPVKNVAFLGTKNNIYIYRINQ